MLLFVIFNRDVVLAMANVGEITPLLLMTQPLEVPWATTRPLLSKVWVR